MTAFSFILKATFNFLMSFLQKCSKGRTLDSHYSYDKYSSPSFERPPSYPTKSGLPKRWSSTRSGQGNGLDQFLLTPSFCATPQQDLPRSIFFKTATKLLCFSHLYCKYIISKLLSLIL